MRFTMCFLLYLPVMFYLMSVDCLAQDHNAGSQGDLLVQRLEQGLSETTVIQYNGKTKILTVGDLLIPVTDQVLVKREKHDGSHTVELHLQNGNAITSITDPSMRKAWLALEFKSKKTAKAFIKSFRQIAIER